MVCSLSLSCPSAQSTGSPLFSMASNRLTPSRRLFFGRVGTDSGMDAEM